MIDVRKTQLSIFIGFLFLILFSIVFYLFRAAITGDIIARWVLFLVFGITAIGLASFAVGYVILLLTQREQLRGTEVHYRRTTQQPSGTWIDISQLPSYVAAQQKKKTSPKKSRRRSRKKT